MTAYAIPRTDWEAYCNALCQTLPESHAEIELSSARHGYRTGDSWHPWIGISYDPDDDVFDIALEGRDDLVAHVVERPLELLVDMEDIRVCALQITDGDGVRHLVRLRDMTLLPAPNAKRPEASKTCSR